MTRRRAITALSLVLALCAGVPAAASAARSPAQLAVGFDADARLGSPTALRLGLAVDPRHAPSAVTEIRLRFPASLGLATSGLGLAECRRSALEFEEVLIEGRGLAGCPGNAVMGYGSARAEVRIGTLAIPEYARITLLSGPVVDGLTGLVALVDGRRPFGGKLAYAGRLLPARAPFGGELSLAIPPVPNKLDAIVALLSLEFAIGSREIVYRERVRGRTVAYRPDGIMLPQRCPRGGFRFQLRLAFADGSDASAGAVARCPQR